jgi:hypothetical protein
MTLMTRRTVVVEYGDGPDASVSIRLTLAEADLLSVMRRERLMNETTLPPDADPELRRLRRLYIDVISATVQAEGIPWPLSFEDFCKLPHALITRWSEAVWRLNLGWVLMAGG